VIISAGYGPTARIAVTVAGSSAPAAGNMR